MQNASMTFTLTGPDPLKNGLWKDLDARGHTVKNLGDPTNDQDAVNLRTARRLIGTGTGTGNGGTGGDLAGVERTANKGAINGYAGLGSDRLVPSTQLRAASLTLAGIVQLTSTLTGTSSVLALTQAAGKLLQDNKADKAKTLAGYGIADAYTKAQTDQAIANSTGGGGNADITATEILNRLKTVDGTGSGLDADLLDGVSAVGFVQEATRNQPSGFLGLNEAGGIPGNLQGFRPDPVGRPSVFVPLMQRLGQEVVLTDGYVEGSNLADFSDLIDANLAYASAARRPFVIPAGKFAATRQFAASGTPISVFGFGPTMSVVEWQAGSSSSGFDFSFNDDDDFAFFEDFGLQTKLFNQGTALRASFAGKIIDNNGNPVIVSRFQPCGRARGLIVRGTDGTLTNGFNKGINVDAPLGFNVQDCHLWGASNGADPNYASDTAIYLGKAQGNGHPVECSIKDCRTFRWGTALLAEGMEGVLAHFNQLVGCGIGMYFKDSLQRPHLDFSHNHCNVAKVGVLVDNASQVFIEDNLIYQVIGANETTYGVSIAGDSKHVHITNNSFEGGIATNSRFEAVTIFNGNIGVIDGNTFRQTVKQPGYDPTMYGITLSADAKRYKVGDNNIFDEGTDGSIYGPIPPLTRTLADFGVENKVPGKGARYSKTSEQYASGDTSITFQSADKVIGPLEDMSDGAFTVPVSGLWQFAFGVVCNAQSGTHFISIKKNSLGVTALVADSKEYNGGPIAMNVNTGPITVDKGDVLYPVFNSGYGTSIKVHPATFFEARRLK